ncbi:MAG TPA: bifunctional aspartate transaminase/aspartate 4-decarboxylase [Acetobacteraceae bacterium]|nr:bifunctional aspartate transaminase/aspartate 4-decarboxylase [Acetobacteraceae bacterium]
MPAPSADALGTAPQDLNLRRYEHMSPFEIKDELIRLARTDGQAAAHMFLNAGRGNPNWIATRAREIFFLLGQFGIEEATSAMMHPAGIGGMPRANGIAERLRTWLSGQDSTAAPVALSLLDFAIGRFQFQPDAFVHELVDAIIGDNYPVPDRVLGHAEQVVHAYLLQAMCGPPYPSGRFDLFPTEGGTAAICYIFRSLKANGLLLPGDRIALGTPIFTPYLEIPELEDYGLHPVYVNAPEDNDFQFTDTELSKLTDPAVKAFFLVNPGNPTSVAISPEVRAKLAELVRTRRLDLILITDDVYATFVDDFRSLLAELPLNTIGVYSYSKYFGCTGWRLGVIALHQDNVIDRQIAALPELEQQRLDQRYGMLALEPRKMRFIDRMVADSRDVALNHTAGLSPPQQAMMTLFSLVELADHKRAYRQACIAILRRRVAALVDGLGLEAKPGALFDNYYGLIDIEFWLRKYLGNDVARFITETVHPLDIVFRLARDHGIVLLNGGGFHAPDWSVRVSFANLDDSVYDRIGDAVRTIAHGYVAAYRAAHPTDGGSVPEAVWPWQAID